MIDGFVCALNIASNKQQVFLPDGLLVTIPNKDFAKVIVDLVQEYENYSLKIFGNEDYAEGYIEAIQKEELTRYNRNLIKIEYNKEQKNV